MAAIRGTVTEVIRPDGTTYKPSTGTTGTTASPTAAPAVSPPQPNSPSSLYNIGVRQALNNMGIDNNRIGYTGGYVTVDGRNVIRPQINSSGNTFTDQATLNSAQGILNQLNVANKVQQQVLNPTQNANPYDSQISDVLAQLTNRMNNPTPYDPYSSTEYAAYEAQALRDAQRNNRTAQESLGASGLGRSSILSDRVQRNQQAADEYLDLQVVPQLIAANQAREQQALANLGNLIGLLSGQQSVYDTRGQNEFSNSMNVLGYLTGEDQRQFDNRVTEAGLTGSYINPEAQSLLRDLLNLKQRAEAPGVTAAERTALSQSADVIRNLLPQYGVDPNSVGANVTYAQASQVQPGRTLQGQAQDFNQQMAREQFAYQKARDAISDQQWRAQFDENARQFGLEYALRDLSERNQQSYREAQIALSQDDNDRQWYALDQELSSSGTPEYNGLTPTQVIDAARQRFAVQTNDGRTVVPQDPATQDKIYQYVGSLGLPYGQDDQVMLSLGLSKDTIKSLDKKYGVDESGK